MAALNKYYPLIFNGGGAGLWIVRCKRSTDLRLALKFSQIQEEDGFDLCANKLSCNALICLPCKYN